MARLTKLQIALIEASKTRADGALLPPPETPSSTEAALSRALGGLVKKGLATRVTPDGDDDGDPTCVLTEAGGAALAPRHEMPAEQASPDAAAGPARPGGKLGVVVKAISRKRGATLAELTEATGWQPHTARAALTRLRQRGFPAALTEEGGRKAYRLQG